MGRTLRLVAVAVLLAATASAQHDPYRPDIEYDGRFTFVRLRWKSDFGFSRRGFSSAWNHDYPRAEQHLGSIVRELTNIDVRTDGSRILTLDDPELFRHPIAFMLPCPGDELPRVGVFDPKDGCDLPVGVAEGFSKDVRRALGWRELLEQKPHRDVQRLAPLGPQARIGGGVDQLWQPRA